MRTAAYWLVSAHLGCLLSLLPVGPFASNHRTIVHPTIVRSAFIIYLFAYELQVNQSVPKDVSTTCPSSHGPVTIKAGSATQISNAVNTVHHSMRGNGNGPRTKSLSAVGTPAPASPAAAASARQGCCSLLASSPRLRLTKSRATPLSSSSSPRRRSSAGVSSVATSSSS
jgi:hypothetical protein